MSRNLAGRTVRAAENGQDRKASMINARQLTRREMLLLGAAALASSLAQNIEAGEDPERHGLSAFGDLKYPPDFKHFDYVNPNAPKGGVFSHIGATRAFNQNFLTFNSLNSFILKGDGAQGMELTFASLMARATDEALPRARCGYPRMGSPTVF
jgi:microcin C transport system substrate-binding protein